MTDEARARIGVIGCGFFARNHLHAWADLASEGVEIVAVCDVDGEKAEAAAAAFGVPRWYRDAGEMLASETFDLVDIVTRVDSHKLLVDLCLRQRQAAIVQKPFGLSLQDCRDMAAAARNKQTFLAVHENFRFQRPNRLVSEIIASGAIGQPTWGRISFRTGYDIFFGQPYLLEAEQFVIFDLGAHVLDMARCFFGDVERLSAETQRRNPKARGEDTATMMLRHRSGAVVCVECTYGSRRLPDVFPAVMLEIEGELGGIRTTDDLTIEVTSDGEFTQVNGDAPVLRWAERPWHVVQESVRHTCAHILSSWRTGREADVSASDNLKTFALCEAAYEAAETGRAVRPAD